MCVCSAGSGQQTVFLFLTHDMHILQNIGGRKLDGTAAIQTYPSWVIAA